MRVAAIGRTEMLYDSILEIQKKGHKIVLIITCEHTQSQYKKNSDDFKLLSNELGADFLFTKHINSPQVLNLIKKNKPDVAISINWKTVIGQKVINSFPYGVLNAHAGDLPRYKGNAVRNWAIIAGEKEITLTIHLMSTDLDSGPILFKRKTPILPDTRIGNLYDFVIKNTPIMFADAIDGLENGTIAPKMQTTDPKKSLRCYPRLPRDSEINWNRSAIFIDRLIRASSEPFMGAYTYIGTKKLIVWRAHVENTPYQYLSIPGQVVELRPKKGEVAVATGKGFLVLEYVETDKNGRTKPTTVIKTIRTRLGMHISKKITELKQEIENLKEEIHSLQETKQ